MTLQRVPDAPNTYNRENEQAFRTMAERELKLLANDIQTNSTTLAAIRADLDALIATLTTKGVLP